MYYLTMFASDADSERATSTEDYQNTCADFISDICKDYKDWVDRYNLPITEEKFRKEKIDEIVKTTNNYIYEFGDTIKKIDIIMNDGINKMAENTAGYPFNFDVLVNGNMRYIIHDKKPVKLGVKAVPREGRQVRLCNYDKNTVFLSSSSSPMEISYSNTSFEPSDMLDDIVLIKPSTLNQVDVLSITLKAEEVEKGLTVEGRGYTSLIIVR